MMTVEDLRFLKRSEKRLCICCMEEHEVKTVFIKEHAALKN